MAARVSISAAVEGLVDEAVLRRLVGFTDLEVGRVLGLQGKKYLLDRLAGYNSAARFSPWVVMIDLDGEDCAPKAVGAWLPEPSPFMCFRGVEREIEAWLMADREALAGSLGFSAAHLPINPDAIDNPKEFLVNVARRSRRRSVVVDMVPEPGTKRIVGPGYTDRLLDFVAKSWDPERAAQASQSLSRCISRMRSIAQLS